MGVEVQMKARVPRHPALQFGVFMGGVVLRSVLESATPRRKLPSVKVPEAASFLGMSRFSCCRPPATGNT